MPVQSHQYSLEEIYSVTRSSEQGLSTQEAAERLRQDGPNSMTEHAKRPAYMLFLAQFADFMILVLIGAAVISIVLGDAIDAYVIIGIVIINAVIGYVQESRAEKAMEALKSMATPIARVMRDGRWQELSSHELVLGDIVQLEAGNVVPADVRLVSVSNLRVDEAALTGESHTVEKIVAALGDELLPLGDKTNCAFKGTNVTHGVGRGLVVATGMSTELGKIARLLQEESNDKTPLQKRLADFGRRLAIIILVICLVVFTVGIVRGEDTLLMLLTAISLAVAAIPEALPAVVTIALAMSAKRMVQKKALIRKLPAVETLGSVTTICTDKTGTLTKQRMEVRELHIGNEALKLDNSRNSSALSDSTAILLRTMALNNESFRDDKGTIIGEPTEVALARRAEEAGITTESLSATYPRVGDLPFDSERKRMTTVHKRPDGRYEVLCKGAPDLLIGCCDSMIASSKGDTIAVDATRINVEIDSMAAKGQRVLAFAYKLCDEMPVLDTLTLERDLVFLGLCGMIDPPRDEVFEAVKRCKQAQIRPVMITGDHPLTAEVIAREIGIISNEKNAVMHANELHTMSDDELSQRVEQIRVFARVAPEQKLRIVKALQAKGQYVAMTGDGVNDAPALKRADIGIAMGINGTEVSKEASSMILLDDNFATIINAVEEGRRVFDNIRKFIKYTMTSNSGEIWTIFLAPFFGLPIPLLPVHILWINLVTDGLPGLALAAEPAEGDVMSRAPRAPGESIFAQGMGTHIIWVGLLMGFVPIITQAVAIRLDDTHWQTMVFTVLCLSQMGHVLAIRSERRSLFSIGLLTNRPLAGAFVLTLVLQMATIYVPVLQPIFRTQALSPMELLLALAASSVVFITVEIEKLIRRRKAARA